MKIAILDDYQNAVTGLDCFSMLAEHDVKVFTNSARGVGQLAIRLVPFDALILIRERTAFGRVLLGKLPHLKLISQTGKVGSHIDVHAASERGIVITECAGDPTAPAELTWALIMAAQRKIVPYASNLKDGLWQIASNHPQYNTLGRSLKGRTLAIWGYGNTGQCVAQYGKAFGMRVMIWGSGASCERARADGFSAAASKEEFFAQADVLSLHLRLSDTTRHIVQAADLACMKPDALLVNTSRAELIAPGALEMGLLNGHPGAAALDVFETEPLPLESNLLRMENVLATPHLGYVEKDSYERYFAAAFQNVLDFAAGTPRHIANLVP